MTASPRHSATHSPNAPWPCERLGISSPAPSEGLDLASASSHPRSPIAETLRPPFVLLGLVLSSRNSTHQDLLKLVLGLVSVRFCSARGEHATQTGSALRRTRPTWLPQQRPRGEYSTSSLTSDAKRSPVEARREGPLERRIRGGRVVKGRAGSCGQGATRTR